MYYAGIGSRETPRGILITMTKLAMRLSELGFVLRSGGADGADTAFAKGATKKQIFRPYHATPEAIEMARSFHPVFDRLPEYVQKLHARNCFQVLGSDLNSPSLFVVCYTKDGAETETWSSTGGTGQAIRIAIANQIPVFNLKNEDAIDRLHTFLIERNIV